MNDDTSGGLSRRRALGTAAAAAGGLAIGSGAVTGFPTIWAQNIKNITLRQVGTGVSNAERDCREGKKDDLGFTLQMTALDSDAATQRVATQPNSYDIADVEYWICKKVFPSGHLQPMDTKKIKYYDEIVPIFTTGKLTPTSVIAQGTAPNTVGFVEGRDSTKFAQGADRVADDGADHLQRRHAGHPPGPGRAPITNWRDLVDPAFKGKASILNIPSIGIMDAAMVCESLGVIKYGDKGNMTKPEIDKTMATLTDYKKQGQFRAFWKTFDESVNLMTSGEVVIQSMWSPAVTAVRSQGHRLHAFSRWPKAIAPGAAGWVWPSTCPGWSWMPPTNTSTGICPAGSART